jgi:hypothetical protein
LVRTGSFKSIVATSGVENINAYALTCIIDALLGYEDWVGGQVHVDIYGECVVRQVGIIIVKTTVATQKRSNIASNRRCFHYLK